MDRVNKKAKELLLEYYLATQALIDVSRKIGSESGIDRLFSLGPIDRGTLDLGKNEFKVISIEEWKKRRNFSD